MTTTRFLLPIAFLAAATVFVVFLQVRTTSTTEAITPQVEDTTTTARTHKQRSNRKLPKIIPWMEANAPTARVDKYSPNVPGADNGATYRELCMRGIASWRNVTDTVVVSTVVGNIKYLYPYLMKMKPKDLHIIGGVKTAILPGATKSSEEPYDYADESGWQRIAIAAQAIVRMTQNNVVLLENEGALWRFNSGKENIDLDKLKKSLQPLRETGIQFWWYLPDILVTTKSFPDRKQKTTALVTAISEAIPNSVFVHSHGWLKDRKDPGYLECERELFELAGIDCVIPFIWVRGDGFWRWQGKEHKKRCFNSLEGLDEIRRMPGNSAIVYPGVSNWVLVAREFDEQLTPRINTD